LSMILDFRVILEQPHHIISPTITYDYNPLGELSD